MNDTWRKPFTQGEIMGMRRLAGGDEAKAPPPHAFWRAMRRLARNIPFSEDLVSAWLCLCDPSTSPRVKLMLAGALAYFVLPLDLSPDILPFLGFADDAAILAAAISAVGGSITPGHRERARAILAEDELPTA